MIAFSNGRVLGSHRSPRRAAERKSRHLYVLLVTRHSVCSRQSGPNGLRSQACFATITAQLLTAG